MPTPTQIVDGRGTRNRAKVTSRGQVVTGAISYDDSVFKELAEDDTAYNFYVPLAGQQFVVTGIILKGDKQIGASDATVVVYEATAIDSITEAKTLLSLAVADGDILTLLPLNLLVSKGVWLNAKTSDDDVHMTIMGYYIDE